MNQPPTQASCDRTNALREYEAAHKVWMATPVWSPENAAAVAELGSKRAVYDAAVAAHETEQRQQQALAAALNGRSVESLAAGAPNVAPRGRWS